MAPNENNTFNYVLSSQLACRLFVTWHYTFIIREKHVALQDQE
jgi:hypothetical protein